MTDQQRSCVVLGGGGFIGLNLCRRLVECGFRVRVFDRECRFPEMLSGVEWHQGDFFDTAGLEAVIEPSSIVFHLVHTTIPQSANLDMAGDVQQNVVPSLALLDICRKVGVARIVFVSSAGTIYGRPQEIPTPETAPTNPITAYGISKLAIEKYLALYQYLHQLDYRVLRVTNPYGPFQVAHRNQGVIAAILSRALSRERIEIWGDGSVVRDFIFVEDLAEALVAAAGDQSSERIFNIGSGQGLSLLEIVAAIEHELGTKLEIDWKPGRAVDVPVSVVSIKRAECLLGWKPRTPFASGLRRTIAWWRSRSV